MVIVLVDRTRQGVLDRDHCEIGLTSPERIRTIPPAVDVSGVVSGTAARGLARRRLGLPAGVRLVGTVGRIDYQKAPEDWLEALASCGDDVWGMWIGDGPLRGRLLAQARRRGLAERLRLLGHRDDVAVAPVDSLDQALELANDTEYGLTAGFYSEDQGEIDRFLNTIEAGVVYVNRRAGATTGAWPGVQPFGGWKGSGTTGRGGGGLHYVQQYLHEQAQSVIKD